MKSTGADGGDGDRFRLRSADGQLVADANRSVRPDVVRRRCIPERRAVDCVPTFVTVTVSMPWPTLSMSSRILSPAEMLATDDTLMLVAPAFASAARRLACPACRLR